MRRDYKFTILYMFDGELWTYTSCKFFSCQDKAVENFPGNASTILATLKLRRRYNTRV
jgi:hypothetical protein